MSTAAHRLLLTGGGTSGVSSIQANMLQHFVSSFVFLEAKGDVCSQDGHSGNPIKLPSWEGALRLDGLVSDGPRLHPDGLVLPHYHISHGRGAWRKMCRKGRRPALQVQSDKHFCCVFRWLRRANSRQLTQN